MHRVLRALWQNRMLSGGASNNQIINFILKKCLAFDNRVIGFDQNNNRGSMTLYNCTGYRNGKTYSIVDTLAPGKMLTLINCVALGSYGSLSTAGMRAPRKADGSLPDVSFLFQAAKTMIIFLMK